MKLTWPQFNYYVKHAALSRERCSKYRNLLKTEIDAFLRVDIALQIKSETTLIKKLSRVINTKKLNPHDSDYIYKLIEKNINFETSLDSKIKFPYI